MRSFISLLVPQILLRYINDDGNGLVSLGAPLWVDVVVVIGFLERLPIWAYVLFFGGIPYSTHEFSRG
jgi:hypothetical protein